jgi:multidrug transporter EmrE-like cation transporter
MGLVNVLWSGLSILIILSTGALFFNETITKLDMVGVIFIILGIVCILWEGTH